MTTQKQDPTLPELKQTASPKNEGAVTGTFTFHGRTPEETEGAKQILSGLDPRHGGWNTGLNPHHLLDRPLKGEIDPETGVRVVTYSFPDHDSFLLDDADKEKTYPKKDRWVVKQAMEEISSNANLEFREVPPEESRDADIRISVGPLPDEWTGAADDAGNITIIEDRTSSQPVILHELLHVLGLSHPGAMGGKGMAGGENPAYTDDDTCMSYNKGLTENKKLGPLDVAALQYLYSKPIGERKPYTLLARMMPTQTYLFSDKKTVVDLSVENSGTGELMIGPHSVVGTLASDFYSKKQKPITMRLVGETQIHDVIANNNTDITLVLEGNALPNRLQGGKHDDLLIATGDGDILTGNKGSDEFAIKDGFNHIITDLNMTVDKDKLTLPYPIAKVQLHYCDSLAVDGKTKAGTEVLAMDKDNHLLASVIALNAMPDAVIEAMHCSPEALPEYSVSTPDHPSGLPSLPSKNTIVKRGK